MNGVGPVTSRLVTTLALAPLLAACDSGGPTTVEPRPPDPVAGAVAFEASCGPCHASGDGLDLAVFDFPAFDIVRRGVDHVDSATARDIAAYVATLSVEPLGRFHRLFQPAGTVGGSDWMLWNDVVGTDGFPGELTVEDLASLDLRDFPVPLPFPLWSSETDESDWMPEAPLPGDVLDAEDGAVRRALESYHAEPTMDRLLSAVDVFARVTAGSGETGVCYGSVSVHTRPAACFEARRWMSSLTAMHLVRSGELRDVPHAVAELWWDTGEAAVSVHFDDRSMERSVAAAWLYMGSVFAPEGFASPYGLAESSGYMGQFLQSEGLPRLAVVVTLRRLASRGPIHVARPFQSYWDLSLAVLRAPHELRAGVLELGLPYLLREQVEGRLPTGDDLEAARRTVERSIQRFHESGGSGDPDRDARIDELAESVLAGLDGA